MKQKLLIIALMFQFTLAYSQIAFVSIDLAPDAAQFVAIQDIPQGVTINFTDNGVASNATSFESDGEGTSSYTVPTGGITCGTVVSVPIGSMAISNSGDQVTAYFGSLASPTIIAHISSTAWITTGSTSSTTSYQPASGNVVNPVVSASSGSAVYSGSTSGTSNDILLALTTASNFTTTGDPGTFGGTFTLTDCTVFPIVLSSFKAKKQSNAALLSFATALEQNNDYFSIERSADGLRFEEIGQVKGAGNSLTAREYSYTDNAPLRGINYYRLKQTDYDGKFSFSPVVSLSFDGVDRGNGVRLSPQPVKDQLAVTLEQAFQQDARWELYDLSGRLLQAGTLAAEANSFSIEAATLTNGAYVLRITGDQQVITRKFEKN